MTSPDVGDGHDKVPASPKSPQTSSYAIDDNEDADYSTINGNGTRLLFAKNKVFAHPTPSTKDNVPGYLALLQQKVPRDSISSVFSSPSTLSKPSVKSADLLLAWIPENALGESANVYAKVDMNDDDEPPRMNYFVEPPRTLTSHPNNALGTYAFAVPVSSIYSLLVRPPSLGWWFGSIIINSRAGDSFPALFFHDTECESTLKQRKKLIRESFEPYGPDGTIFWGGDEVLRWLRRYIKVEKSTAEPNIYLLEPAAGDLQAAKAFSPPKPKNKDDKGKAKAQHGEGAIPDIGLGANARDTEMDPFTKFMKEASWNIMEKFSRVTTFTRRAAQDVAENPNLPIPPQVRRVLRNPQVQTISDEFDSARIYLARWAMGIAEQSEWERRQRIWTPRDILELEETDVGEFELVNGLDSMSLDGQRKPVTLKEWNSWFDQQTGQLGATIDEVKERIFHGGLSPDDGVRKEAWLFLLGVYDWYSTADERRVVAASLRDEYVKLKGAWWERLIDMGGQGEEGEWWREQRVRIEKDVHRTDRNVTIFAGEDIPHPDPDSPFAEAGTNVHLEQLKDMLLTYNEYNKGLGYVQGMSDLLAPIYAVTQDDTMAFWGFQRFMDRMERNFLRDQSGMRTQLVAFGHLVQFIDPKLYEHLERADSTNFFFMFRMLLVWFKREFDFDDILRLWEACWTDYLTSSFHLFVALSILEKHRDVIIEHLKHFDEVLKYVNELSNTLDLESILIRAEALFQKFKKLVYQIDKKQNFPAARISSKPPPTPSLPSKSEDGTGSGGESSAAKKNVENTALGNSKNHESRDISPELRSLLSKEVKTLTEEERKTHHQPTR